MNFFFKLSFWFTILRCTTPVLLSTLAALVASQSGVLNIGLEGSMTVAALCGVLVSAYTHSLFLGFLGGMAAGVGMTMLLAWFIQHFRANAVITGVALNLAASGGSVFFLYVLTGNKNSSNAVASLSFPAVNIPLIKDIPVFGEVLSGHNVLTYLSFILAVVLYIVLKKTKFGVHLRAVGESPDAAASVGVSVVKVRYQAMLISGVLASLGGMYLSMGYVNRFTSGMVAGRGYIALATNAMAAGSALMGMFSSVLYGFGSAVAIYLQNNNVDPYLITVIPYAAIIVFYVIFSGYYKHKQKQTDLM